MALTEKKVERRMEEYAENLKHLIYKAYSDLNEKVKDVINVILVQLQNCQVAFSIKQNYRRGHRCYLGDGIQPFPLQQA